MSLSISNHAVDRFQLHEPRATRGKLLIALLDSIRISNELAGALTNSHKRSNNNDTLFYAYQKDDIGGLFVIEDNTVVTYLRLGPTQLDILFGKGLDGPTYRSESIPPEIDFSGFEMSGAYDIQKTKQKLTYKFDGFDIDVCSVQAGKYFKASARKVVNQGFAIKFDTICSSELAAQLLRTFLSEQS